MSKRIAVIQSSYIPWKGYFDFINVVDEFVFYDDMQYSRRDWRNRNLIKTADGLRWLSIPVKVKGRFDQRVRDVEVQDAHWAQRHWETLRRSYAKAAHFHDFEDVFTHLYDRAGSICRLSGVNALFIQAINAILGVDTPLRWSSEFDLLEGKTERLVQLCKDLDASNYLCGPTAKGYLDEGQFTEAGITLEWIDYSGYPEYRQLHGDFEHRVSILDLIFNEGTEAPRFMKSFPPPPA